MLSKGAYLLVVDLPELLISMPLCRPLNPAGRAFVTFDTESLQAYSRFLRKMPTMPASRLLPFLLLSLLVFSSSRCQTQPLPVLSGRIALQPGWRPVLYLLQPRNFGDIATNYAGVVVDSAVIGPEGNFAFDRF